MWSSVFGKGFGETVLSGHSCQTSWIQNTLCTTTQTCKSVRSSEVASKAGRVLETDHSRVDRAGQEISIPSGVCCRLGSGSASSWWKSIWNWNVLTTWPIPSVINEAPLLCAREGKKGILTNNPDTARLVGRSRCCKSLMSRRLVQSALANLFVSHEVSLWNVQIRKTRCAVAIFSTMKRRQPFRQKRTR